MADEHHVVHEDKEWKVKRSNSKKSSGNFGTKAEAVSYAREVSRNQKTELVIHNKNNIIRRKDSHGKDKNPPRDKDTHKK